MAHAGVFRLAQLSMGKIGSKFRKVLFIYSICLIHIAKGPFQLVLQLPTKFICGNFGFEE